MNLSSFEEIFRTNKKPINFYDSTFIDTDFKDEAFNIDYKPSNSMNDINNNNIICSIEQVKEKKNQFFNNKFFDDDRFKNDENFLSKDIIKEDKDLQDIFKLKRDLKIKKNKLGRKRVFQDIYSNNDEKIKNIDMIRICKNLVLTYTLKFLNEQIKKIYNGFIGGGILFKKLLDITQEEKADNKIESIEIFFQKTLKEIFSVNISKKYTSYLPNHNEIIIGKLLSEKDEIKRKKFEKLLNLTLSDCFNLFIGNNHSDDFQDFPIFENIREDLKWSEKYLDKIKLFLFNFEDMFKNTKAKYSIIKNNNKIKKVNDMFVVK
jgi:hypothetical protein